MQGCSRLRGARHTWHACIKCHHREHARSPLRVELSVFLVAAAGVVLARAILRIAAHELHRIIFARQSLRTSCRIYDVNHSFLVPLLPYLRCCLRILLLSTPILYRSLPTNLATNQDLTVLGRKQADQR